MRKALVGMVALVCAGGVAACGNNDKTKGKTPTAQTAGVPVQNVQNVQKTADVSPAALETAPKPRFTLVLGEGKGGFKFRSVMLSEDAKAKIDEMFAGEKVDLNNARFEIEGYTDNLGSKDVNHQVGLARAKAVKQYLVEQHEFPADCVTVVSSPAVPFPRHTYCRYVTY